MLREQVLRGHNRLCALRRVSAVVSPIRNTTIMSVTTRQVTDDEADIRLDRWFRRHYPSLTQVAIQKMCRTGQIRVDGARAEAATRLQPGQSVRIPPLKVPSAAEQEGEGPRALDPIQQKELESWILYKDDHLIVLNKPSGLPSQGGPGITRHLDGLLDGLRFGRDDRPRLVHRLDRDTSGVIVIARSPGVAAKLAALFRTRETEKVYWAVVAGRPVPVEGRIDRPLLRQNDRNEPVVLADRKDRDKVTAITDYRTLDHAARKLAWLELRPLTGRMHQLRVHCAAMDAPILGDERYGSWRNTDERGVRNTALVEGLSRRLHLHARRLSLPHPAGGMLSVEADLSPHMAETFETLGFTAPKAREGRLR
ncbi:Ribosomal large subunit pseudouridine synthase C [Granulibacter bethesdensis]|uniref:Ribosomal large subunit pseudouridine synthase C n=2 Tax=Granulibacter bethesdensis TaxID=364410 RepID=Q0BUM2_GRABC|nr:Ribosomal large subunit pseudouridine synthase C [Granulibacter bethesdensis CGDNIH1]AHJ67611.1 Ribosomal large subunit pseudouridine synthase C [Granulibacter bethesdensis]APH51275.1 Ribosomal large subunit pseudouridine synthase C [Granulibacter bethesdensis]APH63969.1 Ribosomal large subunit pseudouridine synthase C [Granulibacter bethesdensis]